MTEQNEESAQTLGAAPGGSAIRTFLVLTVAFSAVFYAFILVSGKTGGGAGRYATGPHVVPWRGGAPDLSSPRHPHCGDGFGEGVR